MSKVIQFSFKYCAIPDDAVVLDCRVIRNPFQRGLAHHVLLERVRSHPRFLDLVESGKKLLKAHGVVYVGCDYGRHRSGAVAQAIVEATGAELVLQPRNWEN